VITSKEVMLSMIRASCDTFNALFNHHDDIESIRAMFPCKRCGSPQHRTYEEGFNCAKRHLEKIL